MSPTLKSKAKSTSRAIKDQQKASSASSYSPSKGGNAPATMCSPDSGASHALETSQHGPSHNGRLPTNVEMEEQTHNSPGNGSESDSVSNNGSCSGESEDQKEKLQMSNTLQSEAIPGGDTDKRDKIRQKNEKKHQRQKERRAQELHERCTSMLMSRKLDLLTQQFVAMGFPAERATRALILNEGRVEDSVSWLFEGGTEEEQHHAIKKDDAANMKIDISDELAKITEMEVIFKCSKQEVQRAVVSCDGDLEKVAEVIKTQQKQDVRSTPPREMESGSTIPAVNGMDRVVQPSQVIATSLQAKPTASVAIQQMRREERDSNYSKAAIAGSNLPDPRNVVLRPSLKAQPKLDWGKNQGTTQMDKRWPNPTSGPLFSHSLVSSSLQSVAPPAAKAESRHVVGGEGGSVDLQSGSMREAVVMQRPLSMNARHHQTSTSASLGMSPVATGWESNRSVTDVLKIANSGLGQRYPNVSQSTGSLLNPNSRPFLQPDRIPHSFVSSPLEVDTVGWGGGSWSSGRASCQPSSLATSSSLGIFTGWGSSSGSSGSSSPVDWSNGGLIPQLDYTRVDWSLDSTPLVLGDLQTPTSNQMYEAWLAHFEAPNIRNSGAFLRSSRVARIQDNSSLLSVDPIATVLSPDWTSPFAGKDIFRVPRQIVTFPTP